MGDGTARMSWLSGRPQRVLNLRRPSELSMKNYDYEPQWSVMDDQILLTLPSGGTATSPSTIHLVDINDSLDKDDDTVEFKQIAKLSFHASRSRLLSNRAGFVTVEFREGQSNLTLRTHDWNGDITGEKIVSADFFDGNIVVHGPSIALCIGHGPRPPYWCGFHEPRQIVIWNTVSGDVTRVQIPHDDRGPQCHRGNFQFATPSFIALGGHIDPCYDRPYSVLRSFPTTPSEKLGRYFHQHENFEFGDDHDAIAIPGSSAHNNVIVHHHQDMHRFTVADVGLLTGEIPSEALPSPGYFIDPDYHKDLFHVFSDKDDARTLYGSINDSLPSLAGNKLLVKEWIGDYDHEEDQYHSFDRSMGWFRVLYLYDFDQARCKALRQLSPHSERQDLETRLKEQNPEARVTVVSRMFYASIEEEDDSEKTTSPEWKAHVRERWETQRARETGEAKFPVLEFDDPPEDQDNPRLLFTRSMICLPKIRDGARFALTTSAIIELPSEEEDGYLNYFGEE
ncbi:hypothetical protein TARUN_9131 [Trichoderma arundinaceum]|uniref:Uncharacterized protein n=1 Tax=Trichoderma arundinaceum TaxID=490622 RepID=A0A395NB49_TRIAR|nr:hypothetical protein TARUN_9131 [Trichoderma arundinaceum]